MKDRARSLSRMMDQSLLQEMGRKFYMAYRRAARAGYQFKLCRERDGGLTLRPWDGMMGGEPNRGCLMRTCYIKWGRKKDHKTWHVLRLGKAPFGKTWDMPEAWKK